MPPIGAVKCEDTLLRLPVRNLQKKGAWDLAPGTWDLGPGIWDLGPGTWDTSELFLRLRILPEHSVSMKQPHKGSLNIWPIPGRWNPIPHPIFCTTTCFLDALMNSKCNADHSGEVS